MNIKSLAEVVVSMPPLRHRSAGEVFDADKSEVVKWLLSQPGFRLWACNRFFSVNQSRRMLAYDQETQLWSGNPESLKKITEMKKPGRPKKIKDEEVLGVIGSLEKPNVAMVYRMMNETSGSAPDYQTLKRAFARLCSEKKIQRAPSKDGSFRYEVVAAAAVNPAIMEVE